MIVDKSIYLQPARAAPLISRNIFTVLLYREIWLKIKLSLSLIKHHTMKTYGSG
jgi:hypothetical protein